jgi:hypothetical protein
MTACKCESNLGCDSDQYHELPSHSPCSSSYGGGRPLQGRHLASHSFSIFFVGGIGRRYSRVNIRQRLRAFKVEYGRARASMGIARQNVGSGADRGWVLGCTCPLRALLLVVQVVDVGRRPGGINIGAFPTLATVEGTLQGLRAISLSCPQRARRAAEMSLPWSEQGRPCCSTHVAVVRVGEETKRHTNRDTNLTPSGRLQ